VGQEVVARMQHRGTARNRILPVFSETELPETGSDIRSGETLLGVQLSSAGGFGNFSSTSVRTIACAASSPCAASMDLIVRS
jgi:folate-binding Fe-S cluster repair protein YgfZ